MERGETSQKFISFPRIVESLCPECRNKIKAIIKIKGKSIVMEKTCQEHGNFKEILSKDKNFFSRIESLNFGDGPGISNPQTKIKNSCPFDCGLCQNHKSTTMMGVIDLTNRCNLKCPICFATADASGYIYQPTFEQVNQMMLNLYNLKPAHTPCLQFSGGEPTLHPQFFQILKQARKIGFTQIQIATNGIAFANGLVVNGKKLSGEEFSKKASKAGLNLLYLQFDGVSDEIYKKTRGAPLSEIKKKAIKNSFNAGIRTILVPTIVKGINDNQIGKIYNFAIENIQAVSTISWQPVAFTGRIPEKTKNKMRFTITDLASETEKQFLNSKGSPIIKKNDWYPLSYTTPFSRFIEVITGFPQAQISCHSHCGIGTYLIVDKESKRIIPLPRFVDVPGLMNKLQEIYEQYQKRYIFKKLRAKLDLYLYSKELEKFYNQSQAPDNMSFNEFLAYLQTFINKQNYSSNQIKEKIISQRKWHLLIIAGMHFQDSYNYETERVKRCVVHYAAPDGKLYPFCSYNAGPYFREKVEKQFSSPLKPLK